ncbi:MAG: imidazoleglycerol-phosphate dehydratase HisB [Ardenticatenaceae bacterium]|nr:imidazoleglycerol-phosphate dehydratase HisB [Ardenticatenaceae bacterium]HBY95064.1 imidazoleglycerol-phosphate dehydratase HisB [Chloroflexota bacterium]
MSQNPRAATILRRTNETRIELTLELDGHGRTDIATGVGFFDHMLHHVAVHGLFDLAVTANGDYQIDDHHTVEDVGIALGKAFAQALGAKAGIRRYGHAIVPMDEALALAACDFSGRGLLVFQGALPAAKVGTFDTELVPEFLRALAANAGLTLHVQVLAGQNTHHIIEGIFKALGQALRAAVALDERRAGEVPSTKGLIE